MDVFVSGMGRAADAPCASAAKSVNGLTFCARASYNIQYRRGTEKYPLTPPQERERRRLKARPGRRGRSASGSSAADRIAQAAAWTPC